MISVIICSINEVFASQVKKSIIDTIGVECEFIIIKNTQNPKGLGKVYNLGASRAKYDYLCFVHEDVFFNTYEWGQKIVTYFKNDRNLGLVGIAGSKYKSKTVSGWYTGIAEFDCCNIWHLDRKNELTRIYFNPDRQMAVQQVVSLDGVFLFSKKTVWQEIGFDETLLSGFHLYDLDYSLRVAEKYKVLVTFEIDINHIVKGMHFGNHWLNYTLMWHKVYSEKLPITVTNEKINPNTIESRIRKTWLLRLKHEKLSFYNKFRWLSAIKAWRYFSAWPHVVLFLIKRNKQTE